MKAYEAAVLAEVLLGRAEEPAVVRVGGDMEEVDIDGEVFTTQNGPWLYRYSDSFRDAIAELDPSSTNSVIDRWLRIADRTEVRTSSDEVYEWFLPLMIALARRARRRGESVFAWESL